ncbi:uncharacterized protein LOC133832054 [Humulus lupulus]|uniref:uncharacterized protein LOC133832054 n=1 Tax=Humulus lupulus TaxID=3486 RepID=UPI002B403C7B|nr:uncharacterized protein LOC133832054 [Humulus lupulus]
MAAGASGKFCPTRIYSISLQVQQVDYYKVVWCKLTLPKHRFPLWQVVNSHLLTLDNLSRFKVYIESPLCPVCGEIDESHAHLFFDCSLSKQVMALVCDWLDGNGWPVEFDSWRVWLTSRKSVFIHQIAIMTLAAIVYSIWRNRNNCIFELSSKSAMTIAAEIKAIFLHRLFSLQKHKLSAKEHRFIIQFAVTT